MYAAGVQGEKESKKFLFLKLILCAFIYHLWSKIHLHNYLIIGYISWKGFFNIIMILNINILRSSKTDI